MKITVHLTGKPEDDASSIVDALSSLVLERDITIQQYRALLFWLIAGLSVEQADVGVFRPNV